MWPEGGGPNGWQALPWHSRVGGPYDIAEVGWFCLASEGVWGELVRRDAVTLANLRRLRDALGLPG